MMETLELEKLMACAITTSMAAEARKETAAASHARRN